MMESDFDARLGVAPIVPGPWHRTPWYCVIKRLRGYTWRREEDVGLFAPEYEYTYRRPADFLLPE